MNDKKEVGLLDMEYSSRHFNRMKGMKWQKKGLFLNEEIADEYVGTLKGGNKDTHGRMSLSSLSDMEETFCL